MAEEPDQPAPPGSKDSANQSAALSNLSESHAGDPTAASNSADTAKLGAALSGLSVADKKGEESKGSAEKKAEAPAKKIKINQEDVAFLVTHLEVTKTAATSMLRAADGQREKAVEEFVLPKATKASA